MGDCMIVRRGGGGSAGVQVLAAASEAALPASAKEGTLAVITVTAVGNVTLKPDPPSAPMAGDLWIRCGLQSELHVEVQKKPSLVVFPVSAAQYVGGAWVQAALFGRINGAWKSAATYLYAYGTRYVDGITTQGNAPFETSPFITFSEASFTFKKGETNNNSWGIKYTNISFDRYHTLCAVITTTNSEPQFYAEGGGTTTAKQLLTRNTVERLYTIDISKLMGVGAFSINKFGTEAYSFIVHALYLL
ncbi:MAG: hypothetical protein RR521_12915 [Clostridia bacterium]